MSLILNVIWFTFGGPWLALGHAVTATTLVGIPLAPAITKPIPVSPVPLAAEPGPAASPGRPNRVLL